jgi:hypothetical protein
MMVTMMMATMTLMTMTVIKAGVVAVMTNSSVIDLKKNCQQERHAWLKLI